MGQGSWIQHIQNIERFFVGSIILDFNHDPPISNPFQHKELVLKEFIMISIPWTFHPPLSNTSGII